jgi:hypothetical protein
LSAAQNEPPVGFPPAGGAFFAADEQKTRALKVNELTFGYTANVKETTQEGLMVLIAAELTELLSGSAGIHHFFGSQAHPGSLAVEMFKSLPLSSS